MGGIVSSIFGGGSSGGSGSAQTSSQQPTNQNITTSNIAPWAQPGVSNLINAASNQIFTDNSQTQLKGYTPFDASTQAGQQWVQGAQGSVAGFSPLQQQAQANIAAMQTPSQYGQAMNMAGTAGLGALDSTGQAAQYGAAGAGYGAAGSMYGAAGAQQAAQTAQNAQLQASNYGALGAGYGSQAAGLAPQAQQYGQNAADIGMGGLGYGAQGSQAASQNAGLSNMYGAAGASAGQQAAGQSSMYGNLGAQTGAQAAGQSSMYGNLGAQTGAQAANQSNMLGMGAVGQGQQGANIGASLGQQSTNPSAVGAYMNPYLQSTLAPSLQLLNQQYGQQNVANQAAATQQGAFGGGRSAVMAGLNQQNQDLATNQLVSNAYNQAYNTAQSQMNTANQAALAGNAQAQTGFSQGLTAANQAGQLGLAGTAQGLTGAQQAGQLGMAGTAQGLTGAQQAGQLGMQGYGMGLTGAGQAGQLGVSGANVGLAGTNAAIAGQQAGLSGLNQAGNLLGQGMTGAQTGLSGVGQQLNAGQLGLSGTAQGIQGAQAGMQGAQTGLQGVGAQQAGYAGLGSQGTNLANIAGAQTTTDLGINAAQQAAGATQQQNQQNVLNQAMANYNTAQTYPMTQLAQLESLYTGAPQNITSSTYSAAPSTVSQLAGLGTAAIGASKLAKKGGLPKDFEVKKMATGGIASGVPAPKLDAMLGRLDDQQLAQKADPKLNDPQTAQAALSQQAFRAQMRPAGIGQNYNFQAAGGGIVAFADGGPTDDSIKSVLMQEYKTPIEEQIAKNKAMMPNSDFANKYGDMLTQAGLTTEADKQSSQGLRLLQAGLGIMGGSSPYANVNIGQGAQAGLQGYAQDIKEQKQQQMDLAKQQFELGKFGYNSEADIVKAVQADRKGTRDDLIKILGSETAADAAIKSAQIHAGATVAAAGISAEKAGLKEREGIKTEFDSLVAQGYDANSPITKQLAQQNYLAATRPYGASSMMSAFGQQLAKDGDIKALNLQLTMAQAGGDKKAAEEIQQKIANRTQELQAQFQQQAASMKPGTPNPIVTPTPIPQSNPAATNAAGAVGAQYTWDPKQNKLVPISQVQQ